MNIVIFTHPAFLVSQSMPRFARLLAQAYEQRGHHVTLWAPQARLHAWVPAGRGSKWAGYIDQYLLFPRWVRRQLKAQPPGTLYVFADQALGPWVPLVKHLPHVVHAHDLLALRSALGSIPEHRTGWSGKAYQAYIRRGFQQARQFICISGSTLTDLVRFGGVPAERAVVVHNGLNFDYSPLPPEQAAQTLQAQGLPVEPDGMLMHVSGGNWYKNVGGVLRLYAHYARRQIRPLPLWMVGDLQPADHALALAEVPAQGRVQFFQGLSNEALMAAYSRARALLFPSLYEGFGWPIVEAQACGCPVVTTAEPPMNEVGGPHSLYLPRLHQRDDVQRWAAQGAELLDALLAETSGQRSARSADCVSWARRFTASAAIDGYLQVYQRVAAAP